MKKVSGTLSAEHPRLFKPVPFAFFLASPDGTITTEKWAQSPACVHEEKLERNEGYWQFDFHCNADSSARQAKRTSAFRRSAMPAEHSLKQGVQLQKQPNGDSSHSGTEVFLNGVPRKCEVR
jgi:hypothetical protein